VEISGHRTRAIFDRYNMVSGHDLDDAMAKRAVHDARAAYNFGRRAPGSRFTCRPYEILLPVGAGGMEVYGTKDARFVPPPARSLPGLP
jgi:hypothetical protein